MPRFLETPNWNPGYLNVTPQHTVIMATCEACGAEREFDRDRVPSAMRQALIADIEPLLRCVSCGAHAGRLRFGSYLDD